MARIAVLALTLILGLGGAAAALAFDGEPALYEAAKKEKELTWYTAHYDSETAAAVCQGFEKKYPGVKCNYVRTTAQVAYQRLAQDQKAGIAQCSVISSTDQSHYTRMKQDGWLLPYKPKNADELVDAFRSFNDPGRSINDTVTMLNAKESIVAAGPSATTLESRAKGNPLAVVYPEDGAVLMVSASGIVKNAPAPNAARLFMEYLLSRESSQIMVKQHQDPVNKNVKPMAGAKSIAEVKTIRPTAAEIEKGIPEVKELFRETFGI